ncbi:transcription-repair coupling factor [Petrocella sp. FN5]|uniref:transcription-repair coupling factor n=1 Tax=Petrocella sp. FN5 TaxID=3032002 RepID=UPI0023DAEB93|nr:transcription-repair coupling factor [Petrocella sp. FN5]MDF1616474.1 transcription-repair coupling factor [Petrocella sp. FN5]
MNILNQPLEKLEAFHIAKNKLKYKETPMAIYGAIDSQKCHLVSALSDHPQKLIITYNDVRAREIYEDMMFFQEKVYIYPSKDIIFYSADVHSNDIVKERMRLFRQLIEHQEAVVIMSVDALVDRLMPLTRIAESVIYCKQGEVLEMTGLGKRLIYMGYKRTDQVESRGQFTIRGGIIDIFPLTESEMVRIELWGDEIDSIRQVNMETQRSTVALEEVAIYPAREVVVSDASIKKAEKAVQKDYEKTKKFFLKGDPQYLERLERCVDDLVQKIKGEGNFNGIEGNLHYYEDEVASIFDYFQDPVIYLDEPQRIKERLTNLFSEFNESMRSRYEKGYLLKGQVDVLFKEGQIVKKIEKNAVISLSTLNHKDAFVHNTSKIEMLVRSVNPYHGSFELMIKDIRGWVENQYEILLLCASKTRAGHMVELLNDQGIRAYTLYNAEMGLTRGSVAVSYGSMHKGFEYPHIQLVVLTETELVGKKQHKRQKKFKDGKKLSHFNELKQGDYVVHENHGVGVFKGIEKIEVEGIGKDFIKISYKDDGNLYIATTQLDAIQKYIGAEGKKPKLNKLGTGEWKATKERVKGAVEEIAKDLVALYAKREMAKGYRYEKDTVWQNEFEEMFPYEETEDQLTAIEDTKRDMESSRIMDRLICGDVGYGKTEVAIRAAFKAIQENKQVAYLVPTTILAQQQYNNFVQRMKDFPVKVEMLSRFRTAKEQKKILEGLRRGLIDVVIGTHRLVSKDVVFKDLGLLIVDEEQRFGVKHKEAIKSMKETVDVLTLTATPIPRTLHMSLIGIRDMSVLEDPPEERHPIQTYVLEHNDALIKDAIYRELARGGQVYYVYNRVKEIDEVANQIAKEVPEASVAYAHGQMSERELENIMFDFINGNIDVLVATTIIETGLDISNVNTMIIHNADRMGLSQLYQLRGRVGRSNRVAYAYLMYKRDKVLKEIAEKRLEAIREFTEFGAGFKIAMRDLEIRGAGNLLGAKQHGHMDAVGYDLYCKLLEKEVRKLKNDFDTEESFETLIDINVDAYIPITYINDEVRKIEAYKKIATIESEADYLDIQDELLDRFGELPKPVINLLEIGYIKGLAHDIGITAILEKEEKYIFEIKKDAKIDPSGIPELIKSYGHSLKFAIADQPYFALEMPGNGKKEVFRHIKTLLQSLKGLKV